MSSKPFYLALGSYDFNTITQQASITPASTVPSLSFYRGLLDDSGDTISVGYYGVKIDSWELTAEAEEDIVLDIDLAGIGATVPSAIEKPTLQNLNAFAFHEVDFRVEGTVYSGFNRLVLSGNNNLEAKYAANLSYRPLAIREGALEITGRITVFDDLDTWNTLVTSRSEYDVEVWLKKSNQTITIYLANVAFGEYGEPLRGLDEVDVEIPFRARRIGTTPAIKVIEKSTFDTWDDLPY